MNVMPGAFLVIGNILTFLGGLTIGNAIAGDIDTMTETNKAIGGIILCVIGIIVTLWAASYIGVPSG